MGVQYIGYLNYMTMLFLVTGLIVLFLDVSRYKRERVQRERKVAMWSAWINISFGVALLIGSWFLKRYYW